MSLLSIKINFFKTIKILNIFQYILTHLIISNQIQYNEQDFFSNLALIWLSWFCRPRKTVSMYLKLITTFKTFYGRHYNLIGKFQQSVTHMVTDLFLETLFLRWHGVACPFTAWPLITHIDIMYLCLLQPAYLQLNLTSTDFDIFIACGRCH